jgi:hypothetical protein
VSRRTYLVFESPNQCHLACTNCFARFAKTVYDSSFSRFKVARTLVLHFPFELPVYLNAITVFNGASAAQRSTHDWCARWLMTGKSQNQIPRLNSVCPTRILLSILLSSSTSLDVMIWYHVTIREHLKEYMPLHPPYPSLPNNFLQSQYPPNISLIDLLKSYTNHLQPFKSL